MTSISRAPGIYRDQRRYLVGGGVLPFFRAVANGGMEPRIALGRFARSVIFWPEFLARGFGWVETTGADYCEYLLHNVIAPGMGLEAAR